MRLFSICIINPVVTANTNGHAKMSSLTLHMKNVATVYGIQSPFSICTGGSPSYKFAPILVILLQTMRSVSVSALHFRSCCTT
ncbi:unnamed protein product [Sphagnum tenellum]